MPGPMLDALLVDACEAMGRKPECPVLRLVDGDRSVARSGRGRRWWSPARRPSSPRGCWVGRRASRCAPTAPASCLRCRHGSDIGFWDGSPTSPPSGPSSRCPTGFPAAVLAEAAEAAARAATGDGRVDATDVELVTIDPPGAKDLDQALGITRRGDGFRVHYAIADLGAVVVPGGATRRRGAQARPDRLPARRLGAAAPARALRGRVEPAARTARARPCCGRSTSTRRGSARPSTCVGPPCAPGPGSTTRACRPTSTPGVPTPPSRRCPSWARCAGPCAVARGAIELELPDQEVVPDGAGGWTTRIRQRPPVENVERGDVAAHGHGGRGDHAGRRASGCCARCPRPSPRPWSSCGARRRRSGSPGPTGATAAQVLSGLPRDTAPALALRRAASTLLRGAGYAAFDRAAGTAPPAGPRARRDRRAVRARHRPAAAARGPVRHGGLPRRRRGRRVAGVADRRAAHPARR